MGNTSGTRIQKDEHHSYSTLEFETGTKLFTSEQEARQSVAVRGLERQEPTEFEYDDDIIETEPPKKRTVPTVFRWENGGKQVLLAGSFNDWKTRIPMNFSQGDFTTIMELPEGEYEYKFYVDGRSIHDPNTPTTNDNFGGRNNVITVKKSDFEDFEALDCDANASVCSGSTKSFSGSPPGSYGQLIPSHHNGMHASVPPVLPPHLLRVILNKDVVDPDDPSLLPEPDHVCLNHLYALSIKDGVMTLSGTHRYKEKFVTTLLYKPIK